MGDEEREKGEKAKGSFWAGEEGLDFGEFRGLGVDAHI